MIPHRYTALLIGAVCLLAGLVAAIGGLLGLIGVIDAAAWRSVVGMWTISISLLPSCRRPHSIGTLPTPRFRNWRLRPDS